MIDDPKEAAAHALAIEIGVEPSRLIPIGGLTFLKSWQVVYFAQTEIWPAKVFNVDYWASSLLNQYGRGWNAGTWNDVASILRRVSTHWANAAATRPADGESDSADAARFRWLASHGGCPFAETDPVWDDPAEFRRQVDERIERDAKQAKAPRK